MQLISSLKTRSLKILLSQALVFSLLLSGTSCSLMNYTVSEQTCSKYNWNKEGFELAQTGKSISKSLVAKKCTEQNPKHLADFKAGFFQGRDKFCTEEYGEYWGRNDEDYQKGFCPVAQENKFLVGFSKGKIEHENLQLRKRKIEALEELASKNKTCTFDVDCEIGEECVPSSESGSSFDKVCVDSSLK